MRAQFSTVLNSRSSWFSESGGKEIEEKPKAKKPSSKVIDLVAVLQESLAKSEAEGKKKRKTKPLVRKAA